MQACDRLGRLRALEDRFPVQGRMSLDGRDCQFATTPTEAIQSARYQATGLHGGELNDFTQSGPRQQSNPMHGAQ
jgi:hypothetical protein